MHAKTLEAGAGVTCKDFPAKWTRIFQLHIISIQIKMQKKGDVIYEYHCMCQTDTGGGQG